MAIVKQATQRVLAVNPPHSYDGKYHSFLTKFNFRSAWGKAQPAAGDVLEIFKVLPEHVIDHFVVKTSKALGANGGTYSIGVLKGDINKAHEGTAAGEIDRSLNVGKTGLTNSGANSGLANDDTDIVFEKDDDKERAFGLIVTTAASADLPTDVEFTLFVRYFKGEYLG